MSTELAPGETAPGFRLPRDGGGEVALSDLAGKKVVLYFYPKDDTSGCTLEAVEFSARAAEFDAAGVAVLGVSKDSVRSHDKFRDKHALGVILLSDEGSDVSERYGVWGEKSMYGRKYMGIERATFLIDASGRLARIWRKVKVPGHVEEVLAAAKAL
ncbi:thioredoxin-dependent thiol peroxidase [Amaricoccus sp.]|uniref:thioredoxin-dependent thiol peroxidase n=1 Tax=Amaricoccus sp. TaxID=1872485 RepID=UPI001B76A57C|nr:thioredoxin-dependent thiol peroxidase [Amaricoccus sp.]MBP7001471.1 thioredoxin-dependent thiol peroxidase [Amaricoccus sp.]